MSALIPLLLCVGWAVAHPPGETFVMLLPDVGEQSSSYGPPDTGPYSSGGVAHLDSQGTVLGWRPDRIKAWPPQHFVINSLNGTVCWIFAPKRDRFDAPGPTMRCAALVNLNETWDLPEPRLLSLAIVESMAFDEIDQNWYITVTEKRPFSSKEERSYICSYLFDKCLRLDRVDVQQGKTPRVVYDIVNGLVVRMAYSGDETRLYQLKVQLLDGSEKRLLTDGLNQPRGLAVDSEMRQIFWLEDTHDGVELFTIGYDGKGKKSVKHLEGSRSVLDMEAEHGEVFVVYAGTNSMIRIDVSTGEQTALLENLNNGKQLPWSAQQNFISFRKVQHSQNPSGEACDAVSDCQDFGIPTVADGKASLCHRRCFCPEGYQPVDLECKRVYPAYAVIAAGPDLQAVDLQTDQVATIISNLTDATKVDFFWQDGEEFLVFWVDDGSVFRGEWSPGRYVSQVRKIKWPKKGSQVVDLAVDRAAKHIYWLIKDDVTYDEGSVAIIQLANFWGSVKTVHVNGWQDQRELAVYAHGQISFLDRKGNAPWNLHGLAVSNGVSYCERIDEEVNPSSMVLEQPLVPEQPSPRLLWVDRASQSVELVPSMYQRLRLVTHPSLAEARGMDVLRSRLLWLDSQGQLWTAVVRGSRGWRALGEGSPEAPRMVPGTVGGRAVRVLHPWRQPSETPVCRGGAGCSDFCLPRRAPGMRTAEAQCVCVDGMSIDLDLDPKVCFGPRMVFPGPPVWNRVPPEEEADYCPGRKYSEPENVWATGM